MISEKLQECLNEQITKEFYSAYMYLSMSCYFIEGGMSGFQHWMKKQAKEECEHAMAFINYIITRGGKVNFDTIEMPPNEWECPICVMEMALEHEKFISKSIDDLYNLAVELDDKPTQNFLSSYIDEQVEEEDMFQQILNRLKMAGESKSGWLIIDKELSTRCDS